MKPKAIYVGILLSIIFLFISCVQQEDFPVLKGPYLGQKPPGMTPEVFAPGIVSTEDNHEFSCTFSPDGKEFYFNRGMTIMVCRQDKNGWTDPEPVKFTEGYRSHEPHIPMDNKRLYYGSMRERPGFPHEEHPYGIWMTERTAQNWGTPRYVGYGMYVTTSLDGTIYLTDISDSLKEIIAKTSLMDGQFTDLIRQKGGVITPAPDRIPGRHPCIAPDESFILFDAYKEETKSDGKLFICFHEDEDTWGEAVDLGEIIGFEKCMAPYISPDGKYLFFTANSDIYWMDVKIIEELKPVLKGPYLGQKPPGMTPRLFAPGIISTEHYEHGITFSPKGDEIYFTRRISVDEGNRMFYMELVNGTWTKPSLAPFGSPSRESSPNFSPDGIRLFFNSRRLPPENVDSPHPFNVWMVRKKESDWEEPEMIGPPIMELFPMFVTQAKNGTIYFTGNVERGIYRARLKNGKYDLIQRLPDVINSRNWAGHPFIDQEERFIIFDSNVDEKGTKNLYISFMDRKGEWTESINMNLCLDFPEHAAIPHVSFDGKYLFFSSRGDIYWVDAKIIENLKPNDLK